MIYLGYESLITAAVKKVSFYKNCKVSYFVSSLLAGVYVGISLITVLVMASQLGDFRGIKIIQGASFAAALSLIVFAGAELFTGNVFAMTAGLLAKKIRKKDAVGLCAFCYLGNLIGSIIIAGLFWGTGYLAEGVLEEVGKAVCSKTEPLFGALLVRGILCNMLVCLGVWCVYKMKSETGTLIMIFWAIYLFVVCGFEHSIANMTLFGMETMANFEYMKFLGMIKNLFATTFGNIIGGSLLAFSYWMVSRKIPEEKLEI